MLLAVYQCLTIMRITRCSQAADCKFCGAHWLYEIFHTARHLTLTTDQPGRPASQGLDP